MRIAKEDIPVKVDASPGAVARQVEDFGDATDYGAIAAEHYKIAAGTDLAPLLQGLENDLCQGRRTGAISSRANSPSVSPTEARRIPVREICSFVCWGTRCGPRRTPRWSFSVPSTSTPRC